MKTANIIINLYSFDELNDNAKEKAINDHRMFLLEIMQPEDFISGDPEYDTPEELEKAYNSEYDYYLFNDDPIIESIECNEYLFFENGELARTIHYCGKHENAGKTSFVFNGAEYWI